MNLLDNVLSLVTKGSFRAEVVPPTPLPKAPTGPQSVPSHRTTMAVSASALRKDDRKLLTTDRLVVRGSNTTQAALRSLSYSSPDLSAAVFAALRTGIPEEYTLIARTMEGTVDADATQLVQSLLRRLTYMGNVDGSFGAQMTLQSLSESLGRELMLYGAISGEVALDKARIPASLNAISVTKLKWYDEDNASRPVQVIGGDEIDLDIPTFIYVSVDQDLLDPYSASPLEAAQQPILADLDFNNDMRKALKRVVLPRLLATIDSELVKKHCPPQVLNDPTAFAAYKNELIAAVQSIANQAAPEDAFVSFKEVEFDIMDGGQDPSAIMEKMQKVLNSKLSTGVKTMPVVLGHGGSANASSTESLLFLKTANMIRVKLNEFYSRALTIATRVMGKDVYVEFKYATLDLRPVGELEAYKSMKQSRYLELLSLGMISDEEACIELTGNLPPAGYKPLMGTMFTSKKADTAAQPGTAASGTSGMKGAPEAAKTGPKATVDDLTRVALEAARTVANEDLQRSHEASLTAVQDMAYAISRQSTRPVEVTVAPSEMHLTLAESSKPRSVKVIRGEDGKVTGMEVSNGD
jgi:hypothetical protein